MKPLKSFLVLLLVLFLSCENKSVVEHYKTEYIPKSIEGKISHIELWKGSTLSLKIENKLKEDEISIHTDYEILMQIKKGDYFKKIANSNKCFIERGDSVIYIDCCRFKDEIRDSLGKIEEWKPEEKNHWELKKKQTRLLGYDKIIFLQPPITRLLGYDKIIS